MVNSRRNLLALGVPGAAALLVSSAEAASLNGGSLYSPSSNGSGNSNGYPSVWKYGLQGGIVFPFALYGISDSSSNVPVQMTCWTV